MCELDKSMSEKIMKQYTTRNGTKNAKQVGILIAGISPYDEDTVLIGFTLCHKKDRYDFVKGIGRRPGFGKDIAIVRAFKWKNKGIPVIGTKDFMEEEVYIPKSISKKMLKFVQRCKKYYKDKKLVTWAENLLDTDTPQTA